MHTVSSQSREKSTFAGAEISPCGRNDKKKRFDLFEHPDVTGNLPFCKRLDRLQALRDAYRLKKRKSMATALLQDESLNFSFFCQGMIKAANNTTQVSGLVPSRKNRRSTS
jgi:hypothetical protein